MSQKVLLGLLSVTVSIVAASIMVGYFKLGVVGLCLGIMGGRLIISIGYPILISRFLNVSLSSQLNRMLRPILVTILLFSIAVGLDRFILGYSWDRDQGLAYLYPFGRSNWYRDAVDIILCWFVR